MEFTNDQFEKVMMAKSAEEILDIAKECGIEITEEKAAELIAEMHKVGEISDDSLENVSGGITIAPPTIKYGYEYAWNEIQTALDIACSRNMYSGLATAIGNIRFASFFGATVVEALEKCISIAVSWTEYDASDILQHLQNAHKALTTSLKQ